MSGLAKALFVAKANNLPILRRIAAALIAGEYPEGEL